MPLRQVGDHWVGGPLAADPPANGPYLTCDDTSWRLRCGIEDWFLSQGDAESADEQDSRNGGRATIRVDRFGHAALVGLAFGPWHASAWTSAASMRRAARRAGQRPLPAPPR